MKNKEHPLPMHVYQPIIYAFTQVSMHELYYLLWVMHYEKLLGFCIKQKLHQTFTHEY